MHRPTVFLAALLLTGGVAFAQQGSPGAHFVENWDLDGNGQVSLAEATERRGDVFTTFDADENGFLSAEEYVLFDEARAMDQAQNAGGDGQGKGKGNGQGKGNGHGHGAANEGMERQFNDHNGDGTVSRDEFVGQAEVWIKRMDRDGDGAVSVADFARP